MKYDDRFKYLIGGYYGIKSMDEYSSKLFVLKEVEQYIKDYVKLNKEDNVNYNDVADEILEKESLKEKLQDALILLNEINGPIELILMIKLKIKEIKYHEK